MCNCVKCLRNDLVSFYPSATEINYLILSYLIICLSDLRQPGHFHTPSPMMNGHELVLNLFQLTMRKLITKSSLNRVYFRFIMPALG